MKKQQKTKQCLKDEQPNDIQTMNNESMRNDEQTINEQMMNKL